LHCEFDDSFKKGISSPKDRVHLNEYIYIINN